MQPQSENKIILIVRRTRLDELVVRFNTLDQARFYVERLGADFGDYLLEDRNYKDAMADAQRRLSLLGRLQVVQRAFLPNFLFGERDVVVVLGQDGLVANVLKYLERQPVLGVNPDPQRWEGVLLPFTVAEMERVLPEVFSSRRPIHRVTMAQVTLNTGETLYGVNDLFIGQRTHTSARYTIQSGNLSEAHSSSGIIVSTGLGSTGWLRSIITGANSIAAACAGVPAESAPSAQSRSRQNRPPQSTGVPAAFAWDAEYLYFSVREPWPSKTSAAGITFGRITAHSPLTLISQMPENGVIFSDGIEADFLQFNAGVRATITIADKQGHLVS